MYQRHIEKTQKKLSEGQDAALELQTIADMLDGFLLIPEFYQLPFKITSDIIAKSEKEYSKNQVLFIIQNYAFNQKKTIKTVFPLLQEAQSPLSGADVFKMIETIDTWAKDDLPLPADPLFNTSKTSPFIIEMMKRRHSKRVDRAIKKNDREMAELKKAAEEAHDAASEVAKAVKDIKDKLPSMKAAEEKDHEKKIKELKLQESILQKDVEELKARLETVYNQESHTSQLATIRNEHQTIISEMSSKLSTELNLIHDKIASVSGGKTTKELEEEKAQKEAEELEKKKTSIPEKMSNFKLPQKIVVIQPIYKPKIAKKPTKIRTIFDAIILNDFDVVKEFVQKNKKFVKELSDNRISPLHEACRCNNAEIATFLVENGAEVNAVDVFKMTPLHYAAINSSDPLIKLLVDHKAKTGILNNQKLSPLAIVQQRSDAKTKLYSALEKGAAEGRKAAAEVFKAWPDMVNIEFSNGLHPIHLASGFGHKEMIELLLQWGADIESLDESKNTPLHFACKYNKPECIQFLLDVGADFHALNSSESMPFDLLTDQVQTAPTEEEE